MTVKRYEVRVYVSNILTYSVFVDEDLIDAESALEEIRRLGDKRITEAGDVEVLSIQELR
jgi:hypothetical protein